MTFTAQHLSRVQQLAMQAFAKHALQWLQVHANDGKLDSAEFHRNAGLCGNLLRWVKYQNTVMHMLAVADLSTTWAAGSGDPDYPFGGWRAFHYEQQSGTLYQNPQRLAWLQWAAQGDYLV